MVDKKVNILTRVIPRKPRSKNYQGSGITNIATYSKGASSGESTASTPQPAIEVVSKESYAALTDDNVLSSLRALQEILKRIISSTSDVEASDENTYSALKIDSDFKNIEDTISELDTRFLSKVEPDKTEHLITFLAGLKLGEKYSIDENGNAQLNDIKASVVEGITALFNQVEATQVNATQADINNLTAFTLLVKSLADVGNLNVKDTATILNAVVKQSFTSPKFVSGFLGEGFRLAKTESGDWNFEIDNLTVRKVFQVFELLIQEVKHQGGVVVHSPAGGKITKVTDGGSYWKCEVQSADTFFKDDLVLCQKFTGKVKRYWRAVTSAGDGYINLSKTDCEPNSAIPEEGDEIATLGNKTNTARQSAYLISVVGADAPYTAYYSGINSYSLKGKEHTRIGNLEGVVSPVFGPLKGSGAVLENAYVQGMIKLQNGKTVETVINETSSKLSGDIGKIKTDLQKDINASVSSVKNELGATISSVENSFNTSLNSTKNELNSSINKVQGDADTAKGLAQSAQDAVDGLEIGGRNLFVGGAALVSNFYRWGSDKGDFVDTPNGFLLKRTKDGGAFGVQSHIRKIWVVEGEYYTISTMVRGTFNNLEYSYFMFVEGRNDMFKSDFTNIEKINSKTYTHIYVTTKATKSGYAGVMLANLEGKALEWLEVKDGIKVEKGNKPTDWTPTLEDTEAKISSIRKEIKDVEQRFEIADGQINSHIKETTQLVTEAKNANGESIKTLEQVKVQINDINVTAGKINTTLGEVTKKQGEINSSISNLEQTAGSFETEIEGFKETEAEIKATANKIEATHAGIVLEASEKSAQKAIDGLEIGTINLLWKSEANTSNYYKWSPTLGVIENTDYGLKITRTSSGGNFGIQSNQANRKTRVNKGDVYTVSFRARGTMTNLRYSYLMYTEGGNYNFYGFHNESKLQEDKFITLYATVTAPRDGEVGVLIGNSDGETVSGKAGEWIEIEKGIKLEKGNKPTDWSPAPEDTEAQIVETNAKLGALNDKVIAEVSKTDGISKDLTAVKQDHSSFKVQVKTDITGAINSNNEVIKSSFEMKDNIISMMGKEVNILAELKVGTNTLIKDGFINTLLLKANSITADKLNVGSLLARHLRTADAGPRIEATGSEMKIYGIGEYPNIVLGVNTQGYAVLAYYSNDGQLIYDLGPRGINWGAIKPESWTETKLVGPLTKIDNPKFFDFNLYTNTDSYKGHTYYRYFAGSNPTITLEEKEKENYIYTMKGNFNSKIDDGWYMMEGIPGMSIANNTTAIVRPFGEDGLYQWSTGVRDIPPIYFRMVTQYKGGKINKRKYVCWNGTPDSSGGMFPPNSI